MAFRFRSFLTLFTVAVSAAASALNIVTTTEDLRSIAQYVGGSLVKVTSLVTGARDAHFIDAKPSFMAKVRSADLFIAVGLDLEIAWERAVIDGSGNSSARPGGARHLYASAGCIVLEKPTGAVSRAQGDIHPHGNPHVWLDPWNVRVMADNIAEKLASIDAQNAAKYRANASAFKQRLDEEMFGSSLVAKMGAAKLWAWERAGELNTQLRAAGLSGSLAGWAAKMEPLRGGAVITYHRSFSHFLNRFNIKLVGELEPKPGIPPTPGHLSSLVNSAKTSGVRIILQESFYPTQAAKSVASRVGAKVVIVPLGVGHDPAAKDYFSWMDVLVSRVAAALRG